jgi:outer membrane lipoprotein SlyB
MKKLAICVASVVVAIGLNGCSQKREPTSDGLELSCTKSGQLVEIIRDGFTSRIQVFDQKTGRPVFCDPKTGKKIEE